MLEIDLRRHERGQLKWVSTRYRALSTLPPEWTKRMWEFEEADRLPFEPAKDEFLPNWNNPERAMVVLLLRSEAEGKRIIGSRQLGLNRALIQALFDAVRHEVDEVGRPNWIQKLFGTKKVRGPILTAQGGYDGHMNVSLGKDFRDCHLRFYLFNDTHGDKKRLIRERSAMKRLANEIETQAASLRRLKSLGSVLDQSDTTITRGGEQRQKHVPNLHLSSPPITPNEIFESSGLRSIFKIPNHNSSREDRVRELIAIEMRQKHPRFWLLASSGRSYLHPAGAVWQGCGLSDALRQKRAQMNVVVQSPFSEFAHARALACNVRHHHWEESLAIGLLKKKGKKHPNICIRVSQLPINCSLLITHGSVLYDPYLWACPDGEERVENHFWVFEFQRASADRRDSYNLLMKHFQFLFDHSVPLARFLKLGIGYEERTRKFPLSLRDPRYGSAGQSGR